MQQMFLTMINERPLEDSVSIIKIVIILTSVLSTNCQKGCPLKSMQRMPAAMISSVFLHERSDHIDTNHLKLLRNSKYLNFQVLIKTSQNVLKIR